MTGDSFSEVECVMILTLQKELFLCQAQEEREEKWRRVVWQWKASSSEELLAREIHES